MDDTSAEPQVTPQVSAEASAEAGAEASAEAGAEVSADAGSDAGSEVEGTGPAAPPQAATAESESESESAGDVAFDAVPSGELAERMGITLSQMSAEEVVASMPVAGNTQPYGLLHGGASAVLAETLGSVGAAIHGNRQGKIAVGIELSVTHHRAVSSGQVVGTARALHLGGTLASYAIRIVDGRERLVASARLTCVLRRSIDSRAGDTRSATSRDLNP